MTNLLAFDPLFAELSRRGWFPAWLAVLLGVAAMAVVGVMYVREVGRVGFLPRTLMALVRMAIVFAVAFLLLRPAWVREEKGDRRRPVAVLIDVSQSMDNKDPRPNSPDQWRVALAYGLVDAAKGIPDTPVTSFVSADKLPDKPKRIEVARSALTIPRDPGEKGGSAKVTVLEMLERAGGPLEMATFGSRRTGRDGIDTKWVKELGATEPRTALVSAAWELLTRDKNDMPAAIVLVTDGRENASDRSLDDLARECARLKIPVYVYGVGSSSFGQLQIRDVAVADTIFVDDLVVVPVRYRLKGVTEGKVEIVLKYGDREVARKTVPAKDGDDLREVLTFSPTKEDAAAKKGELTATITVTTGSGATVETMVDEFGKAVKVVDRKLKVLVVDSLPRWDFKYLQRALLRDRRVEARFYLTEADKTAMKSGPPWLNGFASGKDDFRKELFEYDLVILGDIPQAFFNLEQQEVIKDFVAEGGGLIQIAGRNHAPAGWAKSPIGDVLPVEFNPVKFPIESPGRPTGFRPTVLQAAARSPVLSLEDDPLDNAKKWRTLPEIYWHYPVTRLKPAAEAFLAHPTEKTTDGKPMPLMAGHYYGKGYVLFLGFDETWRWRFNEQDKYFGRFWGQLVYVAGVPRTVGTKLTQLSIDVTDPVQGKTGQLYARLFTKDFKPLTAEKIEGRLEKIDADPNDKDRSIPVELKPLPGQPGEYVATIPFNRVGKFALKVDPGNGNPATLDYRVNLPPEHELAPGGIAEADMRKLAEATGGKFYREEDLHQLAEDVKPQLAPFSRRHETILWNRWAMFLLIGLLTVEWVFRKLNGLS